MIDQFRYDYLTGHMKAKVITVSELAAMRGTSYENIYAVITKDRRCEYVKNVPFEWFEKDKDSPIEILLSDYTFKYINKPKRKAIKSPDGEFKMQLTMRIGHEKAARLRFNPALLRPEVPGS